MGYTVNESVVFFFGCTSVSWEIIDWSYVKCKENVYAFYLSSLLLKLKFCLHITWLCTNFEDPQFCYTIEDETSIFLIISYQLSLFGWGKHSNNFSLIYVFADHFILVIKFD